MKSNKRDVVSLEDIALSKIAITLCTFKDITIKFLNNYYKTNELINVAKMLCEYNDSSLAKILMEKLDFLLPFIGYEIYQFADYLFTLLYLDHKTFKYGLSKFFWNTQGIIDWKKTVKILIEGSILNLTNRYKLACAFCLEEDILKLWCMFPEEKQSLFIYISKLSYKYLNSASHWALSNGEQNSIITTKSEEQGYASVSLYEFLCSIHEGVPEATVYYWQKILHEEKLEAISEAMIMLEDSYVSRQDMCTFTELDYRLCKRFLDEIVVFLFNQTDDEYLKLLGDDFEFYNVRILTCFLEWPLLEFFIKKKLQPFFRRNVYLKIMKLLEDNILDCCERKDRFRKKRTVGKRINSYLLILKQVWTISFETNKESIYFYLPSLISAILIFEDKKLVYLILNDLPPSVREDLMISDDGIFECMELASAEEWDIFELLVDMCVPPEKLEDFKSLFRNQIQAKATSLCYLAKEMYLKTASHVYIFLDDVIKKFTVKILLRKNFVVM